MITKYYTKSIQADSILFKTELILDSIAFLEDNEIIEKDKMNFIKNDLKDVIEEIKYLKGELQNEEKAL